MLRSISVRVPLLPLWKEIIVIPSELNVKLTQSYNLKRGILIVGFCYGSVVLYFDKTGQRIYKPHLFRSCRLGCHYYVLAYEGVAVVIVPLELILYAS